MIPIPTMVAGDIGSSLAPTPQQVQVRGTNTATTASATTLATPQPSGIAANDFGIFACRGTGASFTSTPSTAQGWTQFSTFLQFHKQYTASSEAAPSITVSSSLDIVESLLVLKNVSPTTPLDVNGGTSYASGTSFTGPSLTSTVDRTFYVSSFIYVRGTSGTPTFTPPSGMTIIGPIYQGSHGVACAIAYSTTPIASAGTVVASATWQASIAPFAASVVNYLIRPIDE